MAPFPPSHLTDPDTLDTLGSSQSWGLNPELPACKAECLRYSLAQRDGRRMYLMDTDLCSVYMASQSNLQLDRSQVSEPVSCKMKNMGPDAWFFKIILILLKRVRKKKLQRPVQGTHVCF